MGGVSTQTLPEVDTRPEGTDSTDDDAPKMFHYVRTHDRALGEVFPVTKSPKPGSPVCPDCKKIYEGLRPGE